MNAINTQAELASMDASTTNAAGELLSHLWRMKILSGTVEGIYCSLLAHVELTDQPTRLTADRLSVFLELLDEEIDKADGYAQKIEFAAEPKPITSVGKHVDIQLRSAWIDAMGAYQHSSRAKPGNQEEIDAFWSVFLRMVSTRAPDLRSLHEKLIAIDSEEAWTDDSAAEAVMSDVEHLARRYEIAVQHDAPAPTTPAEWQSAIDEYNCARWVEQAHPEPATRFDDPLYEALKQDNIRAFKRVKDALQAVMQLPAPSTVAAADKLQAVIDFHPDADPALIEHLNTITAEIRVLGKGG